jgi:hypothetical protein
MATQNQGSLNVVTRTLAYDNPTYLTRQSSQNITIAAGGATTSSKFYAWTQLIVYGATFFTTAVGTSTYTVNGTATTSCEALYAIFVANTNTTGTAVTLATNTIGAAASGPFFVGGTGPTGSNVNVGGIGGYIGGYQGPYALNTLGGTNTTQPWGTTTYSSGYPGGNLAGQGGLYMNPGDAIAFVSGTDATWAGSFNIQYSVLPPSGQILA